MVDIGYFRSVFGASVSTNVQLNQRAQNSFSDTTEMEHSPLYLLFSSISRPPVLMYGLLSHGKSQSLSSAAFVPLGHRLNVRTIHYRVPRGNRTHIAVLLSLRTVENLTYSSNLRGSRFRLYGPFFQRAQCIPRFYALFNPLQPFFDA